MTAELNSRAGKNFNLDVVLCRMALVAAECYFRASVKRSDVRLLETLLAFYSHARNIEDESHQRAVQFHGALDTNTFSTMLHSSYGSILSQYLAAINLPFELDHFLKTAHSTASIEDFTDYAQGSLEYLLRAGPPGKTCVKDVPTSQQLIDAAIEHDPDRRGFRLDILTAMLSYGADPTELWNWALDHMHARIVECSDYRRGMFLQVASVLIKAGARHASEDDWCILAEENSPWIIDEEVALIEIFGGPDAQCLLQLREERSSGFIGVLSLSED